MQTPTVKINWSVWDNNPVVSWTFDGTAASVSLRLPPISVSNLPTHKMLGVVGSHEEFGSSNLFLYSYDGILIHTFTAPDLGTSSQFGAVAEQDGHVTATIGFKSDSGWKEQAGHLNLQDGTLDNLHRSI